MIRGKALRAWLDNHEAQRHAGEAQEEVARHLRGLPAFEALKRGMEGAQRGGSEWVLKLAERFILTPGLVPELLETLIRAAAADPYYRPHFRLALSEVHSGLMLFDRPELNVTLSAMDADAIAAKRAERRANASLIFTGRHSLFHFVKAHGALLSFWEIPPIEADFTSETSGRCRLVERRRIQDGDTINVDGRRFTFIIEKANQDVIFLQATTSLGAAPLQVEYDSETLQFTAASSTDESGSRTEIMMALLRVMERQDAVGVFREMLKSEHFHTRWQTVREFLALDAEAALPHLRQMAAADPHVEVRQAAAQTLACFFPEDSPLEEEMA